MCEVVVVAGHFMLGMIFNFEKLKCPGSYPPYEHPKSLEKSCMIQH